MQRQPDTVRVMARPIRGLMWGLLFLGVTGCGELGAAIVGAAVDYDPPAPASPIRPLGPEAVEIQQAKLRSTPGGCEIDVTYKNVTNRTIMAGFTYRTFDANGQELKSLSTAVQLTGPGETKTVSSEGTSAGPSGIPCSRIARIELKDGSPWALT